MPIFPFDDEEERRRRMLSPPAIDMMGELDAARRPTVLPEISTARPGLSAPSPVTPPPPPINRQSRFGEMQEAKDAYLEKTPGRGRSALTGALQSFLGGGGLVGAAFGAARGAIDPRGQREQEFNQKIRPQIQERFGAEDQERAMVRQAEQDALNNQYRTAQIGAINRSNMPPPPRQPSYSSASGLGIYNQQTGQVTTPAPPQQPREPAPNYEFDVDRLPYNINNPAERKKYESLPRGKRVKPEKAGGGGKAKKEAKVVSLSQVEKAADEHFGGDTSEAEAAFVRKGYRVVGK